MSRFVCLYFPHFSAWAARRADASLVVPFATYSRDHVTAASPEALLLGVQVGWTLRRLQSRLPEVKALPEDPTRAAAIWQDLLAELYEATPRIEPVRPGLLMADVRAATIEPLVRQWRARCGIADDRGTAELAAYAGRAGEVREVAPGQSVRFLHRAPLHVLTEAGISEKTVERLEWFGWNTVGSLRDANERELLGQFPEGRQLYRYAQAGDTRRVPVWAPPSEVAEHFVFEEPARQPAEWEGALREVVARACAALRGRCCCGIAVVGETAAGASRARTLLREPTDKPRTVLMHARAMLLALLPASSVGGGIELHALEVHLHGLTEPEAEQGELFAQKGRRRVTLGFREVLRGLETRFPASIKRAVTCPEAALPEESFYYVPALRLEVGQRVGQKLSKRGLRRGRGIKGKGRV